MTPELILHHVPWSRSFRILWLCEELGLPVTLRTYEIAGTAMRDSGLPALSPATRVPTLEIDGTPLAESGAIIEYLCGLHAPALTRAADDPERAAYLQWLFYGETVASLIENLNVSHLFLRPPAKPSVAVVKITTARLRASLAGLEARLGDDGYLLPGGFSGADMMMGFALVAAGHFVDLAPFPKLRAYQARLEARPAYARAAEREGPQQFYDRDFYPIPSEG